MLEDGRYDAFVVDARADGAAVVVDLTIVAGPHKGEVVPVRVEGWDRDELDLLGMPASLVVDGGRPSVTMDDG